MGTSKVIVSEARAEKIGDAVKALGLDRVLALEEIVDPQFLAIKRLAEAIGDTGWSALYAVLNSLVSFRLTVRGEEWWASFSRFVSERRRGSPPRSLEDAVRDEVEFLEFCRGASVQREAKKKRVLRALKARETLELLVSDPSLVTRDHEFFLSSLSRALGQKPHDKTIVFSLKMAYYAFKAGSGRRVPAPSSVPIPVDSRVSCVSYSSMLVDVQGSAIRAIMQKPSLVRRAWGLVSARSGIPPLNLDTLIWLVGWAPRRFSPPIARKKIEEILVPVSDRQTAKSVAAELVLRACYERQASAGS